MKRRCLILGLLFGTFFVVSRSSFAVDYVTGAFETSKGLSIANVVEGGRTVYLSGGDGAIDENGKDISNNLEAQVRHIFYVFEHTLNKAGGTTADIVKLTVFLKDIKDRNSFNALRKTLFVDGNYPASSLVIVKELPQPEWVVEIDAIAVIGDKCAAGRCVDGK
jgi:2-iminobutanoate/2-iminopropanoate deaminase